MTLETWVRAHATNPNGILALLSSLTEPLWGGEPRDVSMLFTAAYDVPSHPLSDRNCGVLPSIGYLWRL